MAIRGFGVTFNPPASAPAVTTGYWISQLNTPLPSGWTRLKWDETLPTNSSVTVDILDSSDSVMVSGLTGGNVDLTSYAAINGSSIKLKFNLNGTMSPTIDNIKLIGEEASMPTVGRKEIVRWLVSSSANYPSYIAVGTGNQSITANVTGLAGEIYRFPVASSSVASKYLRVFGDMPSTFSGTTITEMGLFNSSSAGSCFAYRTISAHTLVNGFQNRVNFDFDLRNFVPMMDDGTNQIRNWIAGTTSAIPSYCAWGTTSMTISSTTYSAMVSEVTRSAVAVKRANGVQAEFEAILPNSAGTGSIIRQDGFYSAATGGVLYIYQDHSPIVKNNRFQIQEGINIRIL